MPPPKTGAGPEFDGRQSVAGNHAAELWKVILKTYAKPDGTTTRAAYRFMLYAMRETFDRTAARSPRHFTPPRRGRGLTICRACARDGTERMQLARLVPRGYDADGWKICVDISPPTAQSFTNFCSVEFRQMPPRNKSSCRFYGHFVGVCPNAQLSRVVECHGVARSFR